jgi:phytoene dehydrogenase-like protein
VGALAMIQMLCLPQQSSAFTSQPQTHLPNDPLKSASSSSSSSSKSEERRSPSSKPNVVIVGGGVGGLAVAARMASTVPCHVTIVEKNTEVGGRCGSFDTVLPNVGTFRHERGPSLLLLPDVYRDVFRECHTGSASEDYGLSICQCTPAYQVIFEDGDSIEVGFPRKDDNEAMSPAEILSRERMDSYELGGAEKWDEYMKATSAFLDCGLPNFIEERLDIASFPAFLREALRDFAKVTNFLICYRSVSQRVCMASSHALAIHSFLRRLGH